MAKHIVIRSMPRSRCMVRAHAYLLFFAALPVLAAHWTGVSSPGRVENATMPRALGDGGYGGSGCTPCEELFTGLETTADGLHQQESHLQLRGEPKSGTTFMYSWAFGILMGTCQHLQNKYGFKSCRTEKTDRSLAMTFEPALVGDYAPCSCSTVDRVTITISAGAKHNFPVDRSCPWYHRNGVLEEGEGCWTVGGRTVENEKDLWGCMQEASCEFQDTKKQFVAMRDPRAVAVSTYFYVRTNPRWYERHFAQDHSLDETVLKILPQVCHFTALRHILFDGIVSDRTEIFWYDEALANPLDWHYRWMSLAGILLPKSTTQRIAASVGTGKWATKVNPHPGGAEASIHRTWKDEVSPGIRADMDAILRTWLPAVLLARLDVPP